MPDPSFAIQELHSTHKYTHIHTYYTHIDFIHTGIKIHKYAQELKEYIANS